MPTVAPAASSMKFFTPSPVSSPQGVSRRKLNPADEKKSMDKKDDRTDIKDVNLEGGKQEKLR